MKQAYWHLMETANQDPHSYCTHVESMATHLTVIWSETIHKVASMRLKKHVRVFDRI